MCVQRVHIEYIGILTLRIIHFRTRYEFSNKVATNEIDREKNEKNGIIRVFDMVMHSRNLI